MSVRLQQPEPLSAYLRAGPFVDADHAEVRATAAGLRAAHRTDVDLAAAAFVWVLDEVGHSLDHADPRVTLRASDVLRERVGLCYAKSVLLAALLRAEGVPTALCFQRLSDGAGGHAVHGLVAVHLDDRWHRQDPRGNRPGIDARFSLDTEHLAFPIDPTQGEEDYPALHVEPAPEIVDALSGCTDIDTCRLPSRLG